MLQDCEDSSALAPGAPPPHVLDDTVDDGTDGFAIAQPTHFGWAPHVNSAWPDASDIGEEKGIATAHCDSSDDHPSGSTRDTANRDSSSTKSPRCLADVVG